MEVGCDGSPELLHFGGTFWHTVGIHALMLSYHDLLLGWFQLFLSSVIFTIHTFKCGENIWLIAFLFLSSLMCSFLTYLWLIHLFVFGLMKFSLSWYYRIPVTTTLYFTIQFVCVYNEHLVLQLCSCCSNNPFLKLNPQPQLVYRDFTVLVICYSVNSIHYLHQLFAQSSWGIAFWQAEHDWHQV